MHPVTLRPPHVCVVWSKMCVPWCPMYVCLLMPVAPLPQSTRIAWPFLCNPMAVTECTDSLLVLFFLVAALQETDVLKSTCYPSKYLCLPLLNQVPALCLVFLLLCCLSSVFCLSKYKQKTSLMHPAPQWPPWSGLVTGVL